MPDIKCDIHNWAQDREKMDRGITLTEQEVVKSKELLR